MEKPLCHISAAKFWKAYGSPGFPEIVPSQTPSALESSVVSKGASRPYGKTDADGNLSREISRLGVFDPGEPLHLLDLGRDSRHPSSRFAYHSCSVDLPPESIIAFPSGLSVCRPELNFMQMGTLLPLTPLVQYGMMLCGIYATDPRSAAIADPAFPTAPARHVHRLHRRRRIATKASIERYLALVPSLNGAKRARQALRYILEDSRSPMETIAALILHLPYRMGGYAIPGLRLNRAVPFQPREGVGISPIGAHPASEMAPRIGGASVDSLGSGIVTYGPRSSPVICDLVFQHRDRVVAVEYQGGLYHTGQANIYRDSMRGNALNAARIPLFTLTKEQVRDVDQMHRFAMQLCKRLGVRFRPQIPDFCSRRDALHETLLRDPFSQCK